MSSSGAADFTPLSTVQTLPLRSHTKGRPLPSKVTPSAWFQAPSTSSSTKPGGSPNAAFCEPSGGPPGCPAEGAAAASAVAASGDGSGDPGTSRVAACASGSDWASSESAGESSATAPTTMQRKVVEHMVEALFCAGPFQQPATAIKHRPAFRVAGRALYRCYQL